MMFVHTALVLKVDIITGITSITCMETLVSKVTTKGQATIPLRVRKMLGLRAGDAVAFRLQGKQVELSKARPLDIAFAQATEKTLAPEWSSQHDDDAYADL